MNHQEHNKAVLTRAIQARGGRCRVDCLPVMCSDDETVVRALQKMDNLEKKPHFAQNVVALKQ